MHPAKLCHCLPGLQFVFVAATCTFHSWSVAGYVADCADTKQNSLCLCIRSQHHSNHVSLYRCHHVEFVLFSLAF